MITRFDVGDRIIHCTDKRVGTVIRVGTFPSTNVWVEWDDEPVLVSAHDHLLNISTLYHVREPKGDLNHIEDLENYNL